MTKTDDFIIDWQDLDQRILVVSACSGHGFKFSPIVGQIVRDLIEDEESIELFEKNRHLFSIAYHQGMNLM